MHPSNDNQQRANFRIIREDRNYGQGRRNFDDNREDSNDDESDAGHDGVTIKKNRPISKRRPRF